jgi:hypothetical protein
MLSQNGRIGVPASSEKDHPQLSLDVAVFDPHGRAVTNLNRSDFDLLEDGSTSEDQQFHPDRHAVQRFVAIRLQRRHAGPPESSHWSPRAIYK